MELLHEADDVLRRGQADEQADLAERIDAAIAEPEPDVELVPDMEYGFVARYGSLTTDGKTKDEAMQELARVILAAFNSAPEPDAMEIVRKVRDGSLKGLTWSYKQSTSEAAALIEDYGRRVPRAMLEELAIEILNLADLTWKSGWQEYVKNLLTAIAAKHGVKVEG